MAGPKRTHYANGLRISTRCDTVEELVAKFYRFCEDATLFIPNGNRAIGVETAFCFDLNDGRPAFCGLGTVVEQFTSKENRFGRPGIVLRIARLHSDSQRVYEDMLVTRVARGAAQRPVVDRETPTPWIKPRSLTAAVEIVDSVTLKHVTIVPYPTRVAPILPVTPPTGSQQVTAAPEPQPSRAAVAEPAALPVVPAPADAPPAKFASASSSIRQAALPTDFGSERGTPVFATASSEHAGLAPARPSDPHVMMAPVPPLAASRPRWRRTGWIAAAVAAVCVLIVLALIVGGSSKPTRPAAQTTPAARPQPSPQAAPAPAAPPPPVAPAPAAPPPAQVAPAQPPVQSPIATPPVTKQPIVKKPIAKKPIAKKRVASKPTAKKTTPKPKRAPAKKAACSSLSCL